MKFYKFKQVSNKLLYNDCIVNIYIYNWIGNKFLQLTSPSPVPGRFTPNPVCPLIPFAPYSRLPRVVSTLFPFASGRFALIY